MSLSEQDRIVRRRGYERKYYTNPDNKQKDVARGMVFQAVRNGSLVAPDKCERCGAAGDLEAHHDDYSKPLDVRWLCKPCHYAVHLKTHCVHGHEYTPENTYYHNRGKRFCAECARIRSRKAHHAKRGKLSNASTQQSRTE